MVWHDYIRGFADGQQDRESVVSFNPLLSVLRLTGTLLVFALSVCYAILKGIAGLLWRMIGMVIAKRR